MDSDKAAVWVTNWDTERNGSSLTTRDGTSYLLANAFMLAYDYGQPHIFSGYYYAGVDDGAPGATRTSVPDMTCPTDGIETAGTWHCAQRWTAIRGMIGFRNARRHPPARHRRRHVHGDSSQERQSPVRQQRPE